MLATLDEAQKEVKELDVVISKLIEHELELEKHELDALILGWKKMETKLKNLTQQNKDNASHSKFQYIGVKLPEN